MCCEVLGICRSIWNKFRFECCGQCSTKRKSLTKVRGFFVVSAANIRWSGTVLDAKSNDDDRGQRPKQGGVVGAAF